MNVTLAGHHLWNLRRAWAGANLCRDRLAEIEDRAPLVGGIAKDLRGLPNHDVDYYAWECVRLIKIAEKVVASGLRGSDVVDEALEALRAEAPKLESFRNEVTHVEDNRGADNVMYFGEAVRFLPGGVEYAVDPRYQHHDRLRDLFLAVEKSLLTLAAPDAGSPFPRYDNGAT